MHKKINGGSLRRQGRLVVTCCHVDCGTAGSSQYVSFTPLWHSHASQVEQNLTVWPFLQFLQRPLLILQGKCAVVILLGRATGGGRPRLFWLLYSPIMIERRLYLITLLSPYRCGTGWVMGCSCYYNRFGVLPQKDHVVPILLKDYDAPGRKTSSPLTADLLETSFCCCEVCLLHVCCHPVVNRTEQYLRKSYLWRHGNDAPQVSSELHNYVSPSPTSVLLPCLPVYVSNSAIRVIYAFTVTCYIYPLVPSALTHILMPLFVVVFFCMYYFIELHPLNMIMASSIGCCWCGL